MNKFVKAVLITTVLTVSTRALGLLIKIYISRMIGAENLGYYQIALSLFFLLCTLVTSGIPLVISRKIAGNPKSKSKIVFAGLVLSTTISIVICLVIIMFPKFITFLWGQDSSLSVLLLLLPALFFTALYVPFRGAFWGNKNFFLLGFTELVEQLFRFVACFIFFNLSFGLSGAEVAGVTYSIACALSSLFAILTYFVKGGRLTPNTTEIKPLLSESAPIAILRIGSSAVSLVVSLLFPIMLIKAGTSESDAISYFGIITGMILPLVTIPGTVISSISVALIPELSGKSTPFVARQINLALSYSIVISFLLFPTFLMIGEPLGLFLFNDPFAGELLKVGSVLLLPLGISQISGSILNAINKEKQGLLNYVVGAILLLLSITILPQFMGLYALVMGFFLMSIINALLNLLCIKRYLSIKPLKTLFSSLLFMIPSCLVCLWTHNLLSPILPPLFALGLAGGVSLVMLVSLYQIFNYINVKDFLPRKLKAHA